MRRHRPDPWTRLAVVAAFLLPACDGIDCVDDEAPSAPEAAVVEATEPPAPPLELPPLDRDAVVQWFERHEPGASLGEHEATFEAAVALLREGDLVAAQAKVETLLDAAPTHGSVQVLAGTTYVRLGDPERGATHYRRFLELVPEDHRAPQVRLILTEYERYRGQAP
jgi:hypothetical protein